MSSLTEQIEQTMREPVQATTLGMTGWAEGAEGIERLANEIDVEALNTATRQMMFAMFEGQRKAILRLAKEIEDQDAS